MNLRIYVWAAALPLFTRTDVPHGVAFSYGGLEIMWKSMKYPQPPDSWISTQGKLHMYQVMLM